MSRIMFSGVSGMGLALGKNVAKIIKSEQGGDNKVTLSFDGSWHKRGHSSHHGTATAIQLDSGFVVDTRVCSNFCHVCQTVGKKKEKGEEFNKWKEKEFNKWKEKHSAVCQKNFNGSANAMEVECAEVNFKRSEERRGLIYNGMLSDGDSKANTHLNEIDVYSGIPVVKEDCVNHVAKRMYTALEKITKNSVGTAQTLNRKLTQAIMKEVSGSFYASNPKRGAPDPVKMK